MSKCYKFCEVFLELGLTHGETAFPSPEMPHGDGKFTPVLVYTSGESPPV